MTQSRGIQHRVIGDDFEVVGWLKSVGDFPDSGAGSKYGRRRRHQEVDGGAVHVAPAHSKLVQGGGTEARVRLGAGVAAQSNPKLHQLGGRHRRVWWRRFRDRAADPSVAVYRRPV